MNKEQLQVGHIPSLTWNHLDINAGTVEADTSLNTFVETHFEALPAGVSQKEISFAQAADYLAAHAPVQEEEHVVAGKIPIYHPQKFATGLGAEFDAYLERSGASLELFEVADNTTLAQPIRWDMVYRSNNKAVTGQVVHVGKNSRLTLVMSFRQDPEENRGYVRTGSASHSGYGALAGSTARTGLAGVSTRIVLEEGAQLTLVKAQLLGDNFLHLDDTGVSLADNARMQVISTQLGGREVYSSLQAELVGDNTSFDAKVGYISIADHKLDMNYNVVQRGKKTKCQMTFDGVLGGTAKKRLSDTIDFRRGSKGSEGHEKENVLLLGGDIVNKSLPVILCEEEDMEGTHGATIGQLDDDMLFYMATRGIDAQAARQIMVRARLGAVAREISDEKLRKEIHDFIEDTFA